ADQAFRVDERRGVRDHDSGMPGAAIATAHAGRAAQAGHTALANNFRQRRHWGKQHDPGNEAVCAAALENTRTGDVAMDEYRSRCFGRTASH
ncbi:hypothetical protein, partial [Achromobacter mucicolens]|uniref:hypothetical protein n=1 Tax=Achromobacter mucicolens TaxID=1389922 RepID=UPI00142E7984